MALKTVNTPNTPFLFFRVPNTESVKGRLVQSSILDRRKPVKMKFVGEMQFVGGMALVGRDAGSGTRIFVRHMQFRNKLKQEASKQMSNSQLPQDQTREISGFAKDSEKEPLKNKDNPEAQKYIKETYGQDLNEQATMDKQGHKDIPKTVGDHPIAADCDEDGNWHVVGHYSHSGYESDTKKALDLSQVVNDVLYPNFVISGGQKIPINPAALNEMRLVERTSLENLVKARLFVGQQQKNAEIRNERDAEKKLKKQMKATEKALSKNIKQESPGPSKNQGNFHDLTDEERRLDSNKQQDVEYPAIKDHDDKV